MFQAMAFRKIIRLYFKLVKLLFICNYYFVAAIILLDSLCGLLPLITS